MGAAPHTDLEVRKLGASMWKDIVRWLSGTDLERAFGLFRADVQTPNTFGWDNKNGEPPVARGLEPGFPSCEWSFIRVADLILVIGEGLVGSTVEGMFAANPQGHTRVPFAKCYKSPEYRNKRQLELQAKTKKLQELQDQQQKDAEAKGSRDRTKNTGGSKWDT